MQLRKNKIACKMTKSIRVLQLVFVLGSFCNILGWVENAKVGRRSLGELGVENVPNSMKIRRMMLGIGSEASPSSIWGYLDPEPENTGVFVKRHAEERSNAQPQTSSYPLSELRPAIVLEDGQLNQKLKSPTQGPPSKTSPLIESIGKRSKDTSSSQHDIVPRGPGAAGIKSKNVLSNGKRSEVTGGLPNSAVISRRGTRRPRDTAVSKSSTIQSDIVLGVGKRSAPASKVSAIESDIVLGIGKRSSPAPKSAAIQSDIVLGIGKRSVPAPKSAAIESDIVLGIGKRSSTAPKSAAIQSEIVLGIGKRSVPAPKSAEIQSDIVLGIGKRSSPAPKSAAIESDIVLGIGKRSTPISKDSAIQSDIVLGIGKRSKSTSKSSAIESDIVLGIGKRSAMMARPTQHGFAQRSIFEHAKRSRGDEEGTAAPPAPTGQKRKRFEFDLMPENFAKPLPIFEKYE